MNIELRDYQIDAIKRLDNGKILCGDVGSGKSRTAIAYYFFYECKGRMPVNGHGETRKMKSPKDLYIITTAMKRDKHEWDVECVPFGISKEKSISFSGVELHIDSWQNIKKYTDVQNAFFIFDEQRLCGSGAWVHAFWKIAKKNRWILLSATPGDIWMDYMPVFVANGFFRNKTDFERQHVLYTMRKSYREIIGYTNEGLLQRYRKQILVTMDYKHKVETEKIKIKVPYNVQKYKKVMKYRQNPFTNEPIANASELCYTLRKIVNSDTARYEEIKNLLTKHDRVIIFYNFDYELEQLRKLADDVNITIAEWNGHTHDLIPNTRRWVYLVQYSAGAEGWNCITTNVIAFYSQNYSYKIMTQAAGRINRLNSPYSTLYYYHLQSVAPIDLAIAKALKMKKNFNESAFSAQKKITL